MQASISSGSGLGSPADGTDHVRDVDVLAREADLGQHAVQQLPGRAHERLPLLVLVEAGPLADEHEIGVGLPTPKTTCVPRASLHRVQVEASSGEPSAMFASCLAPLRVRCFRLRPREHLRGEGARWSFTSSDARAWAGGRRRGSRRAAAGQRPRELHGGGRRRHAIVLPHDDERGHRSFAIA